MRSEPLTGWRRIASAMWDPPDDPQIFGALEIDAEALLGFIERARAAGYRLTPTAMIGRAIAHALTAVPDLNIQIRRGRAFPRQTIDVFFITAVHGGHDLSGVKVDDVAHKSALEVADQINRQSAVLKGGKDREFTRTKKLSDNLPRWLLRGMLKTTAYLTETLRLDLPMLGLHRTPFGSAMVTNVATFGIPQGFAPIAWMYDVPLLILVGEIAEKPLVVGNRVVPRPVLPVTATIDHRYVDGWHISEAMRAFREYLADPDHFEPAITQAVRDSQQIAGHV